MSAVTRAQNVKAQKVSEACDRFESQKKSVEQAMRPRKSMARLAAWGADNQEELKVLADELKEFEGVLQDQKHRCLDEADRKLLEERKKRAEKERKLREKARASKSPKRRVAQRLEECRESGQEKAVEIIAPRIPLQVFKSVSCMANESIEMVNVAALQSRCLGLTSGKCSLKEIQELAAYEEKQRRWAAKQGPVQDHIKSNRQMVLSSHRAPPAGISVRGSLISVAS